MAGMNGRQPDDTGADDALKRNDDTFSEAEYEALLLLDRLESLEDEMVELEVTTLDELRARISDLHAKLSE